MYTITINEDKYNGTIDTIAEKISQCLSKKISNYLLQFETKKIQYDIIKIDEFCISLDGDNTSIRFIITKHNNITHIGTIKKLTRWQQLWI